MATLDFEDSFELPKELRGKRLYLANVFLTDAQLAFFKENYGESNSKDANEKNPQFWTDAKKPNGQLFGNLEAFQSSFVRQIWGMLPDENSK